MRQEGMEGSRRNEGRKRRFFEKKRAKNLIPGFAPGGEYGVSAGARSAE
jgi:hypothetical protein